MYARAARFTGVEAEAIERNIAAIRERTGPPEGVPGKALTMLANEAEGTVIAIAFFATEEDMLKGHAVLDAMDPSGGQMGTRASVDLCEVKIQVEAP